MLTIETLRELALSFPEVTEEPHVEKTSFRVKKKIFATYDAVKHRACIKLSETDQDLFTLADKTSIFPLDNQWGKPGWTLIEMSHVTRELFVEAVTTAYCEVAPRKLGEIVRKNEI
ncbi:MAG: MmcQ/YjbR family DNA-binding protein [Cytophagales bacterium]|nr:MmcQ/YjbR family DNA-binding protein [Cytophagales bacterium]